MFVSSKKIALAIPLYLNIYKGLSTPIKIVI